MDEAGFVDSRTAVLGSRVASLQLGTVVVEAKGYEDDDATVDDAGAAAAGTAAGAAPRRWALDRFRGWRMSTTHLRRTVGCLDAYTNKIDRCTLRVAMFLAYEVLA